MQPASASVPRKPPPNLQLLCDVLREGLCVNVQMSTLLKACTASCDREALNELACEPPPPTRLQLLSRGAQVLPGALFLNCLLVDQALQIASCTSSLPRVVIRHNSMYGLSHWISCFSCLTREFHASSSACGMAVYLRCVAALQLPVQVFTAPPPAAVSKSGFLPKCLAISYIFLVNDFN